MNLASNSNMRTSKTRQFSLESLEDRMLLTVNPLWFNTVGDSGTVDPDNFVEVDFNGDGTTDIAVGAPMETVGSGPAESGFVNLFYDPSPQPD